MIHDQLLREIEQFLYREARLLDARQFHAWLDLLTDDVRYWMPVRLNRYARTSKSLVIFDEMRYNDGELAESHEQAIFDEDKASLSMRVARLDTGLAWAEDPPSRTRRFLSNVEVEGRDIPSELMVYCNFMVHRSRGEREQDVFVGQRQDVLRQIDSQWKIARRTIVLDQHVLLAKNISIFF